MASNTISSDTLATGTEAAFESVDVARSIIVGCLRFVALLKLTVMLFALSIFIILVGTLAQVDLDMWDVMEKYFVAWFTWIDFQVFFPRSWFPAYQDIPGGIPFPGGAFIGATMVVNLLSAHLVRFKVQARGSRLAAGLIVLVVGTILTILVIFSGHNLGGLQGEPPFAWTALWVAIKVALAAFTLAAAWGSIGWPLRREQRRVERILLGSLAAVLAAITLWLFLAGDSAYLGDAGMRILWQLIQAVFVGVVLLVGCVILFKRRGGVVLIHGGIALIMFGQFWVAKYDVEEQITIEEGQTVSYARDIRQTELAVIDTSDPTRDRVVAIPTSVLEQSHRVKNARLESNQLGWISRLSNRLAIWLNRSAYVDSEGRISHPSLPFDIVVLKHFKNANLRDATEEDDNPATAGTGKRMLAVPAKAGSGTDMSGEVDLAAAYVKLEKQDGSGDLGTYMLSQIASSQNITDKISEGDKTYELALRFQRNYKPYQVTLVDVRKDDYLGTNTPRNYSSDIRLFDPDRETDRKIHIWMNNPLRYAGETFYQSGYAGPPDFPKETTTLAVVTNSGWMIPYVSCGLVTVGMLYHFMLVLVRFLSRQTMAAGSGGPRSDPIDARLADSSAGHKRKQRQGKSRDSDTAQRTDWLTIAMPAAVVLLFAALFARTAALPTAEDGEFALHEFGALPVIADGRVKPLDTLARNSLRIISNRESFKGRRAAAELQAEWDSISSKLAKRYSDVDADKLRGLDGDVDGAIKLIADETGGNKYRIEEYVDKLTARRYPAIRWLADVIARPEHAERHKVFRIDNLEVLDTLGLGRRKGNLYSVEEIRGGVDEFEKQLQRARKQDVGELSTFQRKLLELDRRIRAYTRLGAAFQPPSLPPLPSQEDFASNGEAARNQLRLFQQSLVGFMRSVDSIQPPLAVPVDGGEEAGGGEWQPYSKAWALAFVGARMLGEEPDPALSHLNKMIVAYQQQKVEAFNDEVEKYQRHLRRNPPEQLTSKRSEARLSLAGIFTEGIVRPYFGNFYTFEAYFNHVAPFFFCWWPYLFAFVLVAVSWLSRWRALNKAAFWLIVFTLLIHSLALLARVYISGRPPITNLYSSAVFIGWGGVLFGLALEVLYRIGVGNAIASVVGLCSLIIAHNLAGDGDTFVVLQAVLDTQFWLATHVITIALGYMATFVAGLLGVAYVIGGIFTPALTREARTAVARMIYGATCFAIIFSLIGTVLGGLWADDSWGRFWGWDPKENGALIIVLWNALILHARWDRMIKERGLAVLAIGGNIVTAWSWFGVNELGVGLHSYGFTEGVLLALGMFVLFNIGLIGAGLVSTKMWWSYRVEDDEVVAAT